MGVLGIFMSRSDNAGGRVSTDTSHFDSTICDFAWYTPYGNGNYGDSHVFSHVPAEGDITWYHWATQGNTQGAADDGWEHQWLDAEGRELIRIEFSNGYYAIQLIGAATTTSAYSATVWPGTLTRMDMSVDMSAGGIDVSIYQDGSATATVTFSTADAGTRTKPTTINLRNYDTDHIYTSELYVADFDTRDTRPVKQVPDAVGNHTDWIGGYADLGDEDGMTAVDSAVDGDKISANVGLYGGPATPVGIRSVVLKSVMSKGATGPQNIDPFVRIASVDYPLGCIIPEDVPLAEYAEWIINPNTGVAWVVADLDTTEIGLEARDADPNFADVSLLLSMDGVDGAATAIDDSSNAHALTFTSSELDTAQKRFGTASLVITADNQYISVPSHASIQMGTEDMTIEAWIRLTTLGRFHVISCKRDTTLAEEHSFFVHDTNVLQFHSWNAGSTLLSGFRGVTALAINTWYHVAVTKVGRDHKLFLDGALEKSQTATGDPQTNTEPLRIGHNVMITDRGLRGWLDEFRFTKGTARYTAAFTPPARTFPRS